MSIFLVSLENDGEGGAGVFAATCNDLGWVKLISSKSSFLIVRLMIIIYHITKTSDKVRIVANDDVLWIILRLIFPGRKVDCIFHGVSYHNKPSGRARIYRLAFKIFARAPHNTFIAVSDRLKMLLESYAHFPESRLQVISELPLSSAFGPPPDGVRKFKNSALVVSSLRKSKGIDRATTIFRNLREHFGYGNMQICGAGKYTPDAGPTIRYLGPISREKLIEQYHHANYLIHLPREPESYGLVVREALACGLVVVCNQNAFSGQIESNKIIVVSEELFSVRDLVRSLEIATAHREGVLFKESCQMWINFFKEDQ